MLYQLQCKAPGTKISLAFSIAGVIEFIPGNIYVTSDYDEVLKAVQSGYFIVVNQPETASVEVETETETATEEAPAPAAPTHRRVRGS
ncbi:hypothetical protein [Microcystis phage Mvi-JY20]|uniref:Uncharacterized protein n=1 Tax=Microcystis phage Mvi-JY20 TaxID=3128146 RepID=A0AAX4QHR3_9CAUD